MVIENALNENRRIFMFNFIGIRKNTKMLERTFELSRQNFHRGLGNSSIMKIGNESYCEIIYSSLYLIKI